MDPFLKLGNTELRVEAFKDWTKEEFVDKYKGCNFDLDNAWHQLQERFKMMGVRDSSELVVEPEDEIKKEKNVTSTNNKNSKKRKKLDSGKADGVADKG